MRYFVIFLLHFAGSSNLVGSRGQQRYANIYFTFAPANIMTSVEQPISATLTATYIPFPISPRNFTLLIQIGFNKSPSSLKPTISFESEEVTEFPITFRSSINFRSNLSNVVASEEFGRFTFRQFDEFLTTTSNAGTLHICSHTNLTISSRVPVNDLAIVILDAVVLEDNETSVRPETLGISVDNSSYLLLNIYRSPLLNVLSATFGWFYFIVWTLSYYPQFYTNIKARSVVGLDFNYVVLSLVGFVCYAIFNCALFWNKAVQAEYKFAHPYSQIPVQLEDVFFSIHATAAITGYGLMILVFERGEQQVSKICLILATGFVVTAFVSMILGIVNVINWLNCVTLLSYIKLVVTIFKYVPQVWLNFRRKRTTGWSIWNVLTDLAGGVFSFAQMFVDCYNYDSWSSLIGNFTKFGLGILTLVFDSIFMIQHYILYRERNKEYSENRDNKSELQTLKKHPSGGGTELDSSAFITDTN